MFIKEKRILLRGVKGGRDPDGVWERELVQGAGS